jgi:DNA-binding beta-propeller fold protein YncE
MKGRCTQFLRMRIQILAGVLLLAATAHAQTAAELYRRQDSAAAAARKARDWAGYRDHVVILDSILGHHPNVRVVNARIYAHMGDTATAYSNLRDFAATGLIRRIEADTDLIALHGTRSWDDVVASIAANAGARGSYSPAFAMPDSDFIAEDITYDARNKRWLVSGIRRSVVVSVSRDGKVSSFIRGAEKGQGFLALAVDSARGILWATTEAIPQAVGFDSTMAGRASLFRYDLTSGKLLQRYDMPSTEPHGAGDIAVAENGDLFIADTGTGAIWVIRSGGRLEQLVAPGEIMSPQGPAIARDGKTFYISDYVRGIARIDRVSGKVRWVTHDPAIAVNGIDGLSVIDGRTLVAVQNGTNPNRVIRIALDPSGMIVTRGDVVAQGESIREPTHGVFAGRDYYFIANGGFGSFGDDGNLVKGDRAVAPVVMRIRNLR